MHELFAFLAGCLFSGLVLTVTWIYAIRKDRIGFFRGMFGSSVAARAEAFHVLRELEPQSFMVVYVEGEKRLAMVEELKR